MLPQAGRPRARRSGAGTQIQGLHWRHRATLLPKIKSNVWWQTPGIEGACTRAICRRREQADRVQGLPLLQSLLAPPMRPADQVQGQMGRRGGGNLAQGAVVRRRLDQAAPSSSLHPASVLPTSFVGLHNKPTRSPGKDCSSRLGSSGVPRKERNSKDTDSAVNTRVGH